MCGVAGLYSDSDFAKNKVDRMLKVQWHRGPDGSNSFQQDDFYAGMVRLAINDVEYGQQPFWCSERRYISFYNGEIYNSPSLRKELAGDGIPFFTLSDGEVIPHLYKKFGNSFVQHLDGMFAIVLFDTWSKNLVLARDPEGEKPLYFHLSDDQKHLIFSSDLTGLMESDMVSRELNLQGIWDQPTFLWIPEPATIYKDVFAVPPGGVLVFDKDKNLVSQDVLSLSSHVQDTDDAQSPVDYRLVYDTLCDAVRSRTLSNVPVGTFLSGGLDSSIITKLTCDELGPVSTYSVGFDDIADPYHGVADESVYAEEFARSLGCKHTTIKLTERDIRNHIDTFVMAAAEPFAVSSGLGILAVARAARDDGVKVLLSGDCADELFGGYSWYSHLEQLRIKNRKAQFHDSELSFQDIGRPLNEKIEAMQNYSPQRKAWALHYYASEREKRSLFSESFFGAVSSSLRHFDDLKSGGDVKPIEFIRHDRRFYLRNEMLRKLDRMTMRYSVEGRVPFAAKSVVKLAARIPYSQLVTSNSLKYLLRGAFEHKLPENIIKRPKHGFNIPIDHWLKTQWADMVEDTFGPSSRLSQLGYLSRNSLTVAKQMVQNESRLNGHTIFSFIILNRFMELHNVG